MRNLVGAAVLSVTLSAVSLAQCAASGLTLVEQGNRLGDWFSVTLTGTPGVPGLLGVDGAAGPVTTPIGTLCVGLTQVLQLLPFTLDAAGRFTLTGIIPALPGLNGASVHLQAAAIDPTQPNGSALSNNRMLTLRPPRVFFIYQGTEASLFGPIVPGSWCAYDVLTDSVLYGPVPLGFAVRDAIAIPSLGWIAFIGGFGNGAEWVQCWDANTGLPTLTILPTPGSYANKLAVIGTTLYVTRNVPPGLDAYALPSGTPLFSTNLVGSTSPQAIILAPDVGVAYFRLGNAAPVVPAIPIVDLTTGLQLPSIPLSSPNNPSEWLIAGNTLHLMWPVGGGQLFGSPALQSIDTLTHTPLQPAPVLMPFTGTGQRLRYGPGQFGNCLFLTVMGANPPLLQINPVTLAPINQVIGSLNWLTEMTLSAGGTEWLMVGCPTSPFYCSPVLQTLKVPSMTISNLGPAAVDSPFSQQPLFSVPSTTVRRALILAGVSGIASPFSTDPATPPAIGIPIPVQPIGKVVID